MSRPVPYEIESEGYASAAGRAVKTARRRVRRAITDRRILIAAGVVMVLLLTGFAAAWLYASRVIDARLSGGAVDLRSGIYAAPLMVRAGQPLAREDLVAYLQQLGYTSEPGEVEGMAGRFAVEGDAVLIEPLDRANVEAGRYVPLRVEFSGERGVRRVVDVRTGKAVKEAALEPIMMSAAYNAREKRTPVTYDAIPAVLREALLVTEDRRFWEHNGVDMVGIARAVRENLGEGDVVQGGSTITQQVVKNLFLTPERTYTRKAKEAFLSYALESKFSKEEIFALYCNEVYLGQTGTYAVHGFAEAAQRYFGKDLAAITVDEAALLAGLVRAPSANSPYRHPERAKERRDLVLTMMAEAGKITPDEAAAAIARPIQLAPITRNSAWLDAPYFDDYAREYVDEAFGSEGTASGRFRVDTTIDINLQRAATKAVSDHIAALDKVLAKGKNGVPPGTVQAALVAIDADTGAVLAMVGGRDYAASQLNRATHARRQPGSVFKPFVYAAALSTGRVTPSTPILDAPRKFKYGRRTYEPGNYGESYANREIPVRAALKYSKNVPTVEVAMRTGLGEVAALAERAGLPRPEPYPSLALGTFEATPLQVAGAYTAFANGGRAVEPSPIAMAEIGGDVEVPRATARTVFSGQVAYVMTDMLSDVVSSGTGAAVRARGVKGAVAGKTGTSRDGWFAGYTPRMVCVVWVGFDDNSQLGMTGSEAALPIWAEFVKQAVAFRPDLGGDSFARPAGLTTAKVCEETGMLATESCPSTYEEVFVGGTQPPSTCYVHSMGYYSIDGEVPLFDDEGNFIGYGPEPDEPIIVETEPRYEPEPEERADEEAEEDEERVREMEESDEDEPRPRPQPRRRDRRPPGTVELPPMTLPPN
jgi:penicillin-binding protein 1B